MILEDELQGPFQEPIVDEARFHPFAKLILGRIPTVLQLQLLQGHIPIAGGDGPIRQVEVDLAGFGQRGATEGEAVLA